MFVTSKYVLHFDLARLAMDRHLYGGSRGLALDSLARHIRPSRYDRIYQSDIGGLYRYVDEAWEARIIENYLFLSSYRTLRVSDRSEFVPGYDWHSYAMCKHLTTNFRMRACSSGPLIPLKNYLRLVGSGSAFLGACDQCLTVYKLQVDTGEKMLRLSTFHCLGSCRSPEDWMWRAASLSDREYSDVKHGTSVMAPCARRSWIAGTLVCRHHYIDKRWRVTDAIMG